MCTIVKIRHFFLLTAIFIISLGNVYAQEEGAPKCNTKKERFTFGPKVSVNFSNQWVDNILKTDFLPGADMGLFFRISPGRIYIQPEIFYAIRNQSVEDWWGSITKPTKHTTNHIGIPILVGVKAIDFRFFKLRFFVGPEFSLELPSHLNGIGCQLGFQAGLGFDIWRFTIDAGYTFLGYVPNRSGVYSNIIKVGVGFKCF